MEWIKLEKMEQLEGILSAKKPVIIFKHSTRCHISSMALTSFVRSWKCSADVCDTYLLDLLSYRSLSNEVAQQTGVIHQSPQLILIKNGVVSYSASHHAIDADEIQSKLT
jgi:bacillithiol system protein YtxJ